MELCYSKQKYHIETSRIICDWDEIIRIPLNIFTKLKFNK